MILFLPPQGRIAGPLHDGVTTLLGRATFMLPLGLALVGLLLALHWFRRDVRIPRRRLAGVALLFVAILPAEQVLGGDGDGTGLVGQWLSSEMFDLFGGPLTAVLLLTLLVGGAWLTFDLRLRRLPGPPRAAG